MFFLELNKTHILNLFCGILLIATAGWLYHPSLQFDYTMDDPLFTYLNRDIRDFDGNYWKFFTTSFYHGGYGEANDFLYRPLTKCTLAWDYKRALKRSDGSSIPKPDAFHQTNIALYVLCVLMIFFLIRSLFRGENNPHGLSLGAALLFCVFPAHVPVVCNIKHREEILACLFGALAFWLYAVYRKRPAGERSYFLTGALLAYLLAIFSKESALFFLPVLILYEISGREGPVKNLSLLWKTFIPFFAMTGLWYALRAKAIGFRIASNPMLNYSYFQTDEGLAVRLLTEAKVFIKYYLWDGLITEKINPWISSRYVVTTETNPSVQGIISLSVLLIVIVVFLFLLFLGKRKQKQIAFWVLFYFTMLFTVSNVIRIDWLGDFRFLFTPSLSYCVIFIIFLGGITSDQGKRAAIVLRQGIALALFSVVFFYFLLKTGKLIPHWQDDLSMNLYSSMVEDRNPLVFNTLGYMFGEQDRTAEQKKYFEKVVRIIEDHPQTSLFFPPREKQAYANALTELAYLNMEESTDLAFKQAQRAIAVFREMETYWTKKQLTIIAPAYYVRAMIYMRKDERALAVQDCKTALKYDSAHKVSQDLLMELTPQEH